MTAPPLLRARSAGFVVPMVAAAYAVAVIVGASPAPGVVTTYAGASGWLHAADLVGGLALLVAGALAWLEPRARAAGLLAMLAGVAWFGADWEGWGGGPAVVRSLGALAAPFVAALVLQLVVAFPRAWPRHRMAQAAVLGAYGVAVALTVGRALVRDPFVDPYCWRDCGDNAFLVYGDQGLAQTLADVWLRVAVVLGILMAAVAVGRLVRAAGAARRTLWPVLAPAALAGTAEAAYAAALIHDPFEDPHAALFWSIFAARAVALALLALGLAWSVSLARRRRLVVARLTAELGEAPVPGTLQETLAAAVGDPTLRIVYWLPRSRRFVGADGREVEPPADGPGRGVTPIGRDGQLVAVVQHDSALVDADELARELGSAARLAVDNERLQAELRAQLGDLRASRARIVERGDSERRRLERDLHDGAQQRLLALSYDLRLARASAERDGDRPLTTLLASATEDTQAALGELRDVAHGIYPAILEEAGLAAALASLADEAPLPVELAGVPAERLGASVERTTYVVVAEAISDASRRHATWLAVGAGRAGHRLVVTIRDDGVQRAAQLTQLADRVGALDGTLELDGTTLRAELPCA